MACTRMHLRRDKATLGFARGVSSHTKPLKLLTAFRREPHRVKRDLARVREVPTHAIPKSNDYTVCFVLVEVHAVEPLGFCLLFSF